jgi:hypothetical protein
MVKVSNENEVAAYHVMRIFFAVIFIAYLISIWIFPEYFSWSESRTIQLVGHVYAAAYLLATLFLAMRGGMWFMEFIFKDDAYEFRYFLLTAPFGAKRLIRVPVEDFYAFKIQKRFLKKTLILYQEKDGKVFQYPPIPIGSFLKEKQRQTIECLKMNAVELT